MRNFYIELFVELGMQLVILGSGQDAGVPQIGCYCDNCVKSREDKTFRRLGPSIALMDSKKKFCYLIDASQDLKDQIDMINELLQKDPSEKSFPIDGIFLTHTHYGHIAGLWSLGKECIDIKKIIIHCTQKMKQFLENYHPFKHLIEQENITPIPFEIGTKQHYNEFSISSFEVPHRDEYVDTVGYIIHATKTVVYLTDLDYWTEEILAIIEQADIALVDASFYSKDELPRMTNVPHPPMIETMERLRDSTTEIYFTHFNHTHKTLDVTSKERKETLEKGFKLAYDGLIIEV